LRRELPRREGELHFLRSSTWHRDHMRIDPSRILSNLVINPPRTLKNQIAEHKSRHHLWRSSAVTQMGLPGKHGIQPDIQVTYRRYLYCINNFEISETSETRGRILCLKFGHFSPASTLTMGKADFIFHVSYLTEEMGYDYFHKIRHLQRH